MIEERVGNLRYFVFENLSKQGGLVHFVSTRESGNMVFSGKDVASVKANIENFLSAFNISLKDSYFGYQVHGDNIAILRKETKLMDGEYGLHIIADTDALIANEKQKCLIVKTADCTPILLFDPIKRVISVIHSGWKGTLLHIAEKAVEKMRSEFGCDPKDIIGGLGPSLGPRDFYIREDVSRFFEKDGINPEFMTRVSYEHWLLNICEVIKSQLISVGVSEENIEVSGISTYSSEDFFSYRRKKPAGHFITGIMLA